MTSNLILKKYFYTLITGILISSAIFVSIDGVDDGIVKFVLFAILLSLITVPIPIALTLKFERVKDLDEISIKEALLNTHIITALIAMLIEMALGYGIIGSPFGIIAVVAVGFVYLGYLVSNIIVSIIFRVLPAEREETPLDDLNE